MGAGALTICHNKTAVQVKEDMKRIVQIPILRPRTVATKHTKLFGVSLFEQQEKGLVEDGVPLVLRRMVEHLRKHALHQEGLFRVNGNVRAVETLKQRLESGEHVDLLSESDSCTVASLLKQYLRDLPEGLVGSAVQQALIRHYQECGDDVSWSDMRDLLQQLPDIHHNLLCYLCHFLTLVECNHKENRMTAFNLATVFGPSVFHVAPGFEAIKEQNICNKIMVKLIQNYNNIFESGREREGCTEELSTLIIVKEAHVTDTEKSPSHPSAQTPTPVPRTKVGHKNPPQNAEPLKQSSTNTPKARPRKRKVRKGKSDSMAQVIPQPRRSAGLPHARPLSIPIVLPLTSELRSPSPEAMDTAPIALARKDTPDTASQLSHLDVSSSGSMEALSSSQEEERPISPFYMSNHLSPVHCRPDVVNFLDRTIRSTVEQHLFDVNPLGGQSAEDCQLTPCPLSPSVTPTARQRRRHLREQQEDELRHKERNRAASIRADTNKENIPSSSGSSSGSVGEDTASSVDSQGGQSGHTERTSKPRKSKHSPTLVQLTDNQDAHALKECVGERPGANLMETFQKGNDISRKDGIPSPPQTFRMKIQESPVTCDTGRVGGEVRGSDPDCEKTSCEDVPRLDLTALTEDNNWGEPVPAFSPLQRESMDREEARLSPHAGGRLIRQLLEEDSDPMLSPRFYAYGQCQQYLDDTEVPPSPPNAHSFVSRRRSSSLGSCDDEKEELTSAQLTKRIHILKKKIHRFEERFEEERKYRPSHSDKVANPEVLRWVNELAKLRKELKEHKLMKSEEDLPPLTRQRSNTLPKSFGSQLEKKPQQEKVPKPPVESTLETISKKLQEKREEVNRPEDIKDMTREQIGAEKVALQKALLYYESIHGRPVTKSESCPFVLPLVDTRANAKIATLSERLQTLNPLLMLASVPVVGTSGSRATDVLSTFQGSKSSFSSSGSPSSKRRGPLLQPIIEGETALFFDDIKEEEDGSEDDGDSVKTQFTVTVRPDVSVLSFLDHMDEEADGFISPVDELSPSKNTTDMRLSNLHSATTQELVEQLQEAREEKKTLRKNLKEFEDQFFRQNGRNVQKEDRSPLAVEYNEYKHVKAKLRLLEVLISKRESTKFI
ncbi:protein FAM13A isoform X2 [Morone saxatilis]|uniref:protein FAM13A isoform X2 n=1 Tax=Morone saxatilis TaxID=34816 RepID=UPI0015E1BABB|nr:protein FAM13A isoform X2 [Morone saxatilis]